MQQYFARMLHVTISLLLTVTFLISESASECRKSYHTFCDDLSDLTKVSLEDAATIIELVVGDNNIKQRELHDLAHEDIPFRNFDYIRYLVITNQIRNFRKYNFLENYDNAWPERVEYIYLYNNYLTRIKDGTFSYIKLTKLSLVNNNIGYIHKSAFVQCSIETLDLSENNLDIIESRTFNEDALKTSTKHLIVKRNRIENIEAGALPLSLEIVDLESNRLTSASNEIFGHLSNLKELYLSRNQILNFPSFLVLKKLEVLDLAHNKLKYFNKDTINNLPKLELLDLGHNEILAISGTAPLKSALKTIYHAPLQLSFAFNRLVHLDEEILTSTAPYTLFLAGNPWSCRCWEEMSKVIGRKQIPWNTCDRKFFTTAITPYCIPDDKNMKCGDLTTDQALKLYDKSDFLNFINVLNSTKSNIECSLKPKRLIPGRDYSIIRRK